LVGGFIEYRRAMNRRWPEVTPFEDEDDD